MQKFEYKKTIKFTIDLISLFLIGFVCCGPWLLWVDPRNKWILLWIIIDIIPCVLAAVWILYRYYDKFVEKFPNLRKYVKYIVVVFVFLTLFVPRYFHLVSR